VRDLLGFWIGPELCGMTNIQIVILDVAGSTPVTRPIPFFEIPVSQVER